MRRSDLPRYQWRLSTKSPGPVAFRHGAGLLFSLKICHFNGPSGAPGRLIDRGRLPARQMQLPCPSERVRLNMRVTLERSNLLKSLNHVHRVVERRNTIPILSNVLLQAEGASLALKATDLDLEVNEATAAMVEQAGATTVPAHLLYDIVRKLPDGAEVMLSTNPDGGSMSVISGKSSFRLQC